MSQRTSISFAMTVIAALSASCGDSASPRVGLEVPAVAQIAGGDRQIGVVGQRLPGELIVLVTDSGGRPLSGRRVNFVVTSGEGGSVSSPVVSSDASGRAATQWTSQGLVATVKHLRGKETLRHARLLDVREEGT